MQLFLFVIAAVIVVKYVVPVVVSVYLRVRFAIAVLDHLVRLLPFIGLLALYLYFVLRD